MSVAPTASAAATRTLPWTFRPGRGFVLLRGWWGVALVVALAIGLGVLAGAGSTRWWLGVVGVSAVGAILLWQIVVWLCERYTLTSDTATWESGVLRRLRVDIPLERVQNTVLYRSLGERLLGLGTIGIASAATDSYEIVWRSVERPHEVHDRLRHAVAAASGTERGEGSTGNPAPTGSERPLPVIGLTGGIGSGKSTVGSIFGELGCLVIDSDQRARAALDRPDVRSQLVAWWGDGILNDEGRIDRSKVAGIVFKEPAERARLEGLVHPIVRQDRAAMIAEAGGRAYRAVIIDAPLLFEAGLDKECDAVVFVDAPRPVRLERVRNRRGWDDSELDRREQSQLPLEEKRSRSTHTVANSGDLAALRSATREVLDRILGGSTKGA